MHLAFSAPVPAQGPLQLSQLIGLYEPEFLENVGLAPNSGVGEGGALEPLCEVSATPTSFTSLSLSKLPPS